MAVPELRKLVGLVAGLRMGQAAWVAARILRRQAEQVAHSWPVVQRGLLERGRHRHHTEMRPGHQRVGGPRQHLQRIDRTGWKPLLFLSLANVNQSFGFVVFSACLSVNVPSIAIQ